MRTNVGDRVKTAVLGNATTARAARATRSGVALQPVIDLIDRVDLGYEALPRPIDLAPRAVVTSALTLAQHTGPAVLVVPLTREVLSGADFDVAAEARRLGVNPA